MSRTTNRPPQAIAKNQIYRSRLATCKTCEHFENSICKKYGQAMAIKAQVAVTDCPVNKWVVANEETQLSLSDKHSLFDFLNECIVKGLTKERTAMFWNEVDRVTGRTNDRSCAPCVEAIVDDFRMELKHFFKAHEKAN